MKTPVNKFGAFLAALLIASCSQQPTTPTAIPAATKAEDVADGRVTAAAEGDVKNGPIEIDLVHVEQTGGVPVFYASAGGTYTIRPNQAVEIYVQIWRSDTELAEAPRLIIDWGVGGGVNERDRIHCGPCRVSRTYNREGPYTVTVTMDDRVGGVTSRTFTLIVQDVPVEVTGGTFTFSNPTTLPIPNSGPSSPYPSNINVSGISGTIVGATVTIVDCSHTFQDDVIILLVAPNGQTVKLMNDAGGGSDLINATVTFRDGAPLLSAGVGDIGPGSFTFSPTQEGADSPMAAPAPAGPFGATLSTLNGIDPNGTWSLFVFDDAGGDSGQIAGGWSLTLTTAVN